MTWLSDLDRLQHLESDLALLPVGWGADQKGPMLTGWQKHSGFTITDLQQVQGIRSAGARTGILTGPLVAFDFDGETSLGLGLFPWNVSTWQIHRDNDPFRLKVLCRPTPSQLAQLPMQKDGSLEFQGKTPTKAKEGDSKGEALEVFFAGGRQVVVLGQHPSSGGNYIWPNGLGPEALSAPPQDWWDHAITIALDCRDRLHAAPKTSSTRNGTKKLDPCPICGRHSGKGGSALWCEETSAGLILCMPGSTFSAEQTHGPLRIGQVVNGYALKKRSQIQEGEVLVFGVDKPFEKPDTRPRHRKAIQNLDRARAGVNI